MPTIIEKILALPDLAAFWKLDETSGDVASDSSDGGHDLVADSVAPFWGQAAGPPGTTSAKWDSFSTRLANPVVALPTFSDDFTAAVWVNPHQAYGEVIGQGAPFHGSSGWCLMMVDVGGGNAKFVGLAGGSITLHYFDNNVDLDTWVMVAIVRDSGVWKMYRDGVLQADTFTSDPGVLYGSNTWLGNDEYPSHSYWLRTTLLSCAFIVNRALTDAEVLDLTTPTWEGESASTWTFLKDVAGRVTPQRGFRPAAPCEVLTLGSTACDVFALSVAACDTLTLGTGDCEDCYGECCYGECCYGECCCGDLCDHLTLEPAICT